MTDKHLQVDALASHVPAKFGLVTDKRFSMVPGNIKAGMKAIGTQKDMWRVDLRKTHIVDGLNPRVKDAIYWAGIEELKESIKKHGWMPDKPLAGYIANIGGESVCVIVEGGRRRDAGLLLLAEMDPELADKYLVPVVTKGNGTSELDMQYGLAQGNSGVPFRPYELACLIKRLETQYGQSDAQILEGLTGLVSAAHLPKLKMISAAPEEIAAMVLSEELSVTEAYDMMVKHGDKAVEVLQKAKALATATGAKKITAKHMPGRKMENLLKKESRPLYDAAAKVQEDPGFAGLSEGTRALIEDLMRELKEKEAQFKAQEAEVGKDAIDGEFTVVAEAASADNDAPSLALEQKSA